jgi:hypothetical protein
MMNQIRNGGLSRSRLLSTKNKLKNSLILTPFVSSCLVIRRMGHGVLKADLTAFSVNQQKNDRFSPPTIFFPFPVEAGR